MASKDIDFPTLATPYSAPTVASQDNRILPRDIFTSGTLPGTTVIRIGDDNVVIDGTNSRITVSDGTNDRVLIGKF